MSIIKKDFHKKTNEILSSSKHNDWSYLRHFIKKINDDNPYSEEMKKIMWKEQCYLNFPILYLSSIYLYNYARKKGCDTFLFATRDCSQLYKVFKKMFPNTNSHYFHCSRIMFEGATENKNREYNNYVKSIVKNVESTIFIDIHGTGKRVINYFEKNFGKVPYCFLLSSGVGSYDELPEISQYWKDKGKLVNIVFGARGSPIEMLNYDKVGTLQDYTLIGPVRDKLEYDLKYINTYHDCIEHLVRSMESLNSSNRYKRRELHKTINLLFDQILIAKPIIGEHINHIGKHQINNVELINTVSFDSLINNDGVYGVVWNCKKDNNFFAIKLVCLDSKSSEKSFNLNKEIRELLSKHKIMKKEAFKHETTQLKRLSKLGFSPKVYEIGQFHQKNKVYGYIIMERLSGSLKDIIKNRKLNNIEEDMVSSLIKKMHQTGIVHGDLKPSNIGLMLSDDFSKIKKMFILDCQKVKYRNDYDYSSFKSLIKRDWDNFYKHVEMNRQK